MASPHFECSRAILRVCEIEQSWVISVEDWYGGAPGAIMKLATLFAVSACETD